MAWNLTYITPQTSRLVNFYIEEGLEIWPDVKYDLGVMAQPAYERP